MNPPTISTALHCSQSIALPWCQIRPSRSPILLLAALLIAGCGDLAMAKTREIEGEPAERIDKISRIIGRQVALPGKILDANFVEEQTGDNQLGPADFKSFCVLKVAPETLTAWRAIMKPLEAQNTPPTLVQPQGKPAWWASPEQFKALEFYSPVPLTGRNNGWVGFAAEGKIYIHSFTM